MAGRETFQLRFAASTAILILLLLTSQVAESRLMFNICSHTAYPSLCQPFVRRVTTPRRATHRTIKALEAKTKVALAEAARFKNGNQAITVCYETLSDAVYNLKIAKRSIRKRDIFGMNAHLTAVVSDYGACVDGFIETGQVNLLQNMAVDLRKIGSNCLTLSTLVS